MSGSGGLFSKGGGVPLTPAQVQLQQAAIQNAQKSQQIFAPVQSFFARQLSANAPGLKEQGRGQAAATGRAAGFNATQGQLGLDTSKGRSAGSGAFLSDMAKGNAMTAGATGLQETAATGAADAHYARGLQEVLNMYKSDQQQGLKGLDTAAQAQAQEAGAVAQGDEATRQGAGQLIGIAASF